MHVQCNGDPSGSIMVGSPNGCAAVSVHTTFDGAACFILASLPASLRNGGSSILPAEVALRNRIVAYDRSSRRMLFKSANCTTFMAT